MSQHPSVLSPHKNDTTARWQKGQVLYDLFEARCRAFTETGQGAHPALEVDGAVLGYGDLRAKVSAYAETLQVFGLRSSHRVGLLLDRTIESYCVMLAVVKLGATYVPLDIKFPTDRLRYICQDADISSLIVVEGATGLVSDIGLPTFSVSAISAAVDAGSSAPPRNNDEPDADLIEQEKNTPSDSLAYIIYTSGSTGWPKGVAVNQSSICNFVAVAAEVYGYTPDDRVYQGLTFAFDFSVEEFWVPLIAGATLVASPSNVQLVGQALEEFLNELNVTAMCCVPTLLATLENDVPSLRLLLVSGEACPQDLVTRWHRPGCRILNAYGPTEATVTATWTQLQPDLKVTIGVPLPTYTICILEPDKAGLVREGEPGEIAIGGIGLAVGYVNRPELTDEKFIPDFLDLPNNPSRRLYRTGDMGRINANGEVEYLGRIDTQVKIKGYRIELSEIEEVLLQIDGIAQAVVTVLQPNGANKELAAYYTAFSEHETPSPKAIFEELKARLPAYMVPAFLEPVEEIPLLPSQKADRKALPAPKFKRVTTSSQPFAAPETEDQRLISDALAQVLSLEQTSIDDHVFDDLGLDSLRAAEFISNLTAGLPTRRISITDIYLAPTVRKLSQTILARHDATAPTAKAKPVRRASRTSHALCGTLQTLTYLLVSMGYLWLAITGFLWVSQTDHVIDVAGRSFVFVLVAFALLTTVPIATKWCLIGRWRKQNIPLWSLSYFRFWLVRFLVEGNPLAAFRGSPVFNCYLRLLGAQIGDNALILCKSFPFCTDLISIGHGTVIRKHTHLTGYRAEGGYLRIGKIQIGDDVTVGAGSVVDIDTEIGDRAQLGHASGLLEGQRIPDGSRYHGSPAIETTVDFSHVKVHHPSKMRRFLYGSFQLASALALSVIIFAAGILILKNIFGFDPATWGTQTISISFAGLLWIAVISLVAFAVFSMTALLVHVGVPRALAPMLKPGKYHSLYGPYYFAAQLMAAFSNMRSFHILFGDSSYAVPYLQVLGIRQPDVLQTGSNFGTSMSQDMPSVCEIGSGTMVSDDLVFVNFEYSGGSFRVGETKLGRHNFLGNNVFFPTKANVHDNCLLASKVMLPIDGEACANTGLLGSPCFEIPRSARSDQTFDPVPSTPEGFARLRKKNLYNLRTMALYLFCNWLALFVGVTASYTALSAFQTIDVTALISSAFAFMSGAGAVYIAQEKLSLGSTHLKPQSCTIHDKAFWWVERHWKLCETPFKYVFRGTPLRPWIHRFLGVEMGRRVFDDGSFITEKTLTRIGDDTCINAEASVQAHSLEDGLFKSDYITIKDACSIGPMAYVHYGVVMEQNTSVSSDSFVMKGTKTKSCSVWAGNPAEAM